MLRASVTRSLHVPLNAAPARLLCTMRRIDGSPEDAYFKKMQRAQLDKLKQAKPSIDEANEKVRLDKILDTVVATDGTKGVREEIREALRVQLLLWKHDQDLKSS